MMNNSQEIKNIWAIGRNYADHAKELNNEIPESPLIFLKAGSTATFAISEIQLPEWTEDVHHEVELALQFDKNFEIKKACLALDLTERKKQNELKAKGQPWTLAKSFTGSCPLTPFFKVQSLNELQDLELKLSVNQELRQNGRTSQMIFSLEKIIYYVRQHFPVQPGDLILTGTPSGVKSLKATDLVEVEIPGILKHQWTVR